MLDLVPASLVVVIPLGILLLYFPLELEDAVGARQLAVQDGQQDEVEVGGRRESRTEEFVILDHLTVTEGRIQDFQNLGLLVDAVRLCEIFALIQSVVSLFDLNIILASCRLLLLLDTLIKVGDQLPLMDLVFLDTISALW